MITVVIRRIRCGGKSMTVVILAGGRGRRMNADKARMPIAGRPLLETVLGQVKPYFDEVLISVSPGRAVEVGKIIRRGQAPIPGIVEDERRGQGPMAGILAGLKAARHGACAVVACDIPDVDVGLLRELARAASAADIAVPVTPDGDFEPLFAVYRRTVVPEIERLLGSGERSLIPLLRRCRTARLPLADARGLRNLNTRRDYEQYLAFLAGKRNR